MSELIPVANTDDAGRVGDVVFVHGLGGNPREYWMADTNRPETFWPAWIGEDVPNAGVWSLGYDAAKFAWQGTAMPLFDRAKNALALLDADEIGGRPIVFITHSMGGLLVKQMIQHGLTLGDPRWRAITDQTRGVCFIATPHSGADLANYVKFLAKFLATIAVEDLKANDPQLRGLNEWYRNHAFTRFKTEVYCEKKVTGWKGLGVIVVDDRSADPGLPGVSPVPLDEDHLSICKPASRESLLYKRVRRFVKECLIINPR
jgi:pimeloyl-ACP methyl ester carboxylesterase